jgi:hypothetical protein
MPGAAGNDLLLIGNGGKGPAMHDSGRRWSFGRLLDWHFVHGTRRGNVGKPWTTKTFTDAVGLADRAVRYWLRDEHLPQDTLTIEDRLLGSDVSRCTVWRFELREALARSRAAGRNGDASAPAEGPITPHATGAPPVLVANISIRIRPIAWGDDALAAIAGALGSGDGRLEAAVTALHDCAAPVNRPWLRPTPNAIVRHSASSSTGMRLWILSASALASATMIVHEASSCDGCALTVGKLGGNLDPVSELHTENEF